MIFFFNCNEFIHIRSFFTYSTSIQNLLFSHSFSIFRASRKLHSFSFFLQEIEGKLKVKGKSEINLAHESENFKRICLSSPTSFQVRELLLSKFYELSLTFLGF